MIDIKPETSLIAISRDIDVALKGTGIACRTEGSIEAARFIVRLTTPDGNVLFEAARPSWRKALAEAHAFVKENIAKQY